MGDKDQFTKDQLWLFCVLFTGTVTSMTKASQALIAKLDVSDPLTDAQKAIINEWAAELNTIEAASYSQLMDIQGTHVTPGIH